MTLKKSVLQYCTSFSLLSIFQLLIIRGVVTSDTGKKAVDELYVDGADFSPLVLLVSGGIHSFAFFLQEFFTVILGIFISMIFMFIIRHFSEKTIEREEKRFNKRYTFIMSLAVIVAGVALAHFKLISDIIIMYIPVPAVSWFVFHGSKKEREDNAE